MAPYSEWLSDMVLYVKDGAPSAQLMAPPSHVVLRFCVITFLVIRGDEPL